MRSVSTHHSHASNAFAIEHLRNTFLHPLYVRYLRRQRHNKGTILECAIARITLPLSERKKKKKKRNTKVPLIFKI